MPPSIAKWRRLVQPHFAFLEDYGFHLEESLATSDFWRTRIVYASEDRGVAVDHSVEFNDAEVSLVRLRNGLVPEPQVWVTDAPINELLFDNVLKARAPDRYADMRQLIGLSKEQLDERLAVQSEALREIAADFLEGSFAAMEEGERVIRLRVDETPQELVVWLPDDASVDDQQRAVEEAKATAPSEVTVTTRRYNRRPK